MGSEDTGQDAGDGARERVAPGIADAIRELGETGRATWGAGREAATAFRILVSADISLARSAFGRTLAFTAVAIVFGTTYAGVMPLYAVIARGYFPMRIMGTVFGAATMVSAFGMALGPAMGGWVFDHFGAYGWLYIGSFAIGLGAVAMALTFRPPRFASPGVVTVPA